MNTGAIILFVAIVVVFVVSVASLVSDIRKKRLAKKKAEENQNEQINREPLNEGVPKDDGCANS